MDEQSSKEAKYPPTPSRQGKYARIATLSPKAMDRLELLLKSRNENVALGAVNTILKKVIPDLKSVELGGTIDESGKRQPIQIFINRGSGFVPAFVDVQAPSDSGDERSSPVQDVSVAPASEKDDNSDNGNHNPESA